MEKDGPVHTLGQAAEYASTLDVLVSPSRLTDRIIGPTVGNACPTGACERRLRPLPEQRLERCLANL